MKLAAALCLGWLLMLGSCKTSGPSLFGKRSLHEQYGEKLKAADLNKTTMGDAWFKAADAGLSNPVNINLPYKEFGYFSAEQPKAIGVRFSAKKGERLTIHLDKASSSALIIYMELWRDAIDNRPIKLLESLDTAKSSFTYDADDDEILILRLQPELLNSGEYTLTIQNGPSLAFPVKTNKQAISSFWGADRDGGARRHEGVDIFAPKGAPLIAAADGRITRVEETNIGGKVVWLRPENKNYTLYYAHLDEQLVTSGQQVKAGDVIGKVGNTGNARTTGAHLHFGIYTSGGAIDPLLFVQPARAVAPNIAGNTSNVGAFMRAEATIKGYVSPDQTSTATTIEKNTPLKVESANASWYQVQLPDGNRFFISFDQTQQLNTIRKITSRSQQGLLDAPANNAARKTIIQKGEAIEVLGAYHQFSYVKYKNVTGWMII